MVDSARITISFHMNLHFKYDIRPVIHDRGGDEQMSRFASWASSKSELHCYSTAANNWSWRGSYEDNNYMWQHKSLRLEYEKYSKYAILMLNSHSCNCILKGWAFSLSDTKHSLVVCEGSHYVTISLLSCPHYKAASASTLLADTGNILIVRTWKPLTESTDLCELILKNPYSAFQTLVLYHLVSSNPIAIQ